MRELDLNNFTKELSSGAPVPGGGGASALMGAVSASLCSMVGNLTSGKKKYAEYQQDIERIMARALEPTIQRALARSSSPRQGHMSTL